jgi:hypothetical protein
MAIGGFNNTNCVFALAPSALFNHAPQTAPFNSGTAYQYQGPQGGGITAVLTNMTSRYGYPGNPWFRFDGVNDYIQTNWQNVISPSNDLTLEFYVHFQNELAFVRFAGNNGAGGEYVRIYRDASGHLVIYEHQASNWITETSDVYGAGHFHIVMMRSGGKWSIYVNGAEAGYTTQPTNGNTYTLSGGFTVGGYTSGGSPYVGLLTSSWCAFHNAALSPADIAAHYALGAHFGGIRGTISGSDMLLRAATADAPSGITGLVRSGDCTAAGPLVQRGEYNCANESNIAHHLSGANAPASLFSNCSQEDGGDLVFTLLDGTEVPADVRSFSKAGQTCDIVICLPAVVANTDTTIYWQCGGSAGHRTATMAQVYPSNLIRYPADEASGNLSDKLGNYDGAATDLIYGDSVQIGSAVRGEAITSHIAIGPMTEMATPQTKAVCASWFKLNLPISATLGTMFLQMDRDPIDSSYRYVIRTVNTFHAMLIQMRNGVQGGYGFPSNPADFFAKFAHHVVVVYDGDLGGPDRGRLLLNGELLPLTWNGNNWPATSLPDLYDAGGGNHNIGIIGDPGLSYHTFDEWEFGLSAPSLDFVKSQYYNQRAYAGNGAWDIGEAESFYDPNAAGGVAVAAGVSGAVQAGYPNAGNAAAGAGMGGDAQCIVGCKRLFVVPPENRLFLVPPEDRVFVVPCEDRVCKL